MTTIIKFIRVSLFFIFPILIINHTIKLFEEKGFIELNLAGMYLKESENTLLKDYILDFNKKYNTDIKYVSENEYTMSFNKNVGVGKELSIRNDSKKEQVLKELTEKADKIKIEYKNGNSYEATVKIDLIDENAEEYVFSVNIDKKYLGNTGNEVKNISSIK